MQNAITRVTRQSIQPIIDMVLNTVSDRSKRDYGRALNEFIKWHGDTGQHGLTKAVVNAHIASLKDRGVTDSSINQRLAAIRKLAFESADNGLIDESAAQAIMRIKNEKIQGKRLGNWLSRVQAEKMINAPGNETAKGIRDRAILAVMLGAGLRREEVVTLTVNHLQQREGRWVILDLTGKHNRTRTVPIAAWVKVLIDEWLQVAEISDGVIFRPIWKGGAIQDRAMSSQAIWNIVQEYSPVAKLAPHDLRRTFAKLADKAGAPLAQIQQVLGHASVQTTERYIGTELDLQQSPSDMIQLDISADD